MLPTLTGSFLAGLVLGSFLPYVPLLIWSGLLCAALWCSVRALAVASDQPSSVTLFGALLAGVLYWSWYSLIVDPEPPRLVESAEPMSVVGRIVAPVSFSTDRIVFEIAPMRGTGEASVWPAVRRIRVMWRAGTPTIGQGDVVALSARLYAPHGTHNPGGFDYAAHLRRRGIDAVGSISGPEALRLVESGRSSWRWGLWSHVDHWRQQIHQAAFHSLPPPIRGLYLGLVTGEQSSVEVVTREAFVATGTVHILSISGSHLGLIALTAFVCVRGFCRWLPVPLILWLNCHRLNATRLAVLVTLPLTLGYTLLAGGEVATVRALVMILLMLSALWIGRAPYLLTSLAVAALGTLLHDPRALYDVSFQLSYLSVFALAHYAAWRATPGEEGLPAAELGESPWWGWRRLRHWMSETVMLSVAVTVFTVPLVAWHFHQWPWISPVANLLLLPFAALLLPLCLASAVWLLCSGQTESLPLATILEHGLGLMMGLVSMLARLPAVDWHIAAPSIVTMGLYAWLLFLVVRPGQESGDGAWEGRRVAAAVCLVGLIGWWLIPHRTLPPQTVRVTMIDVGQGDATLLELPDGDTVLIDAGTKRDRFDTGAAIVGPLLWERGLSRIDHAVATHPQLDHVGGFSWLLRHVPVRQYWTTAIHREERFFRDLQEALREHGLNPEVPSEETVLAASGPCRFTAHNRLVGGDGAIFPVGRPVGGTALNNASLVTKLDCGQATMLFPGDVEGERLSHMLRVGPRDPVTLLKVPHHGARSSLSVEWIRALRPYVALLSVGERNPYRHPHPDVMAAYREEGIPVFRTDRDGAVTILLSLEAPLVTITTWRQQQLEPVRGAQDPWSAERQNYRRWCQRYFEQSCDILR